MIIDKIKNIFTKDNDLYCLTPFNGVFEFGEIVSVKKHHPSWWKNLPVKLRDFAPYNLRFSNDEFKEFKQEVLSVKHCPAISDNLNTGLVIKAWSDIKIFVSPDGIVDAVQASEETSQTRGAGSTHPYYQRAGFLPNMVHYKIHSPWMFKTNKYRKFYFQGAYMWNQSLIENNVFIIPGFIDYYTQSGTEINLFLPIKDKSYAIDIKLGDPLVHLFPIDSNPVNIIPKLVSREEIDKVMNIHPKFTGSFKVLKSRNKK